MTNNEGNLLIEWFMTTEPEVLKRDLCKAGTVESMHYHDDWLWLMPVLEKICKLKIGDGFETVDYACPRTFGMLHEESNQFMVRLNGFQLKMADTLVEATYEAIIEFIEWYNNEYKQLKQE